MMAATGILAAERHRRLTGEGRLIRLPLQDVALATAGNLGYLAEAEVNGDERARYGNHIFGTFGHDFRTADGRHVMICIFTTRQLRALGQAAGLADAFAAIESRLGVDLERSEEHTSELQSLMRISYAVFCLKKKKKELNK